MELTATDANQLKLLPVRALRRKVVALAQSTTNPLQLRRFGLLFMLVLLSSLHRTTPVRTVTVILEGLRGTLLPATSFNATFSPTVVVALSGPGFLPFSAPNLGQLLRSATL